jgi:hypothetical protein
LLSIFESYGSEFEYAPAGIFRRVAPPPCPRYGTRRDHNGYNTYCKQGLGSVKLGRYECPSCKKPYEEERSSWEKLKTEFFEVLTQLYQHMRTFHLSYEGIYGMMELIFPLKLKTKVSFMIFSSS